MRNMDHDFVGGAERLYRLGSPFGLYSFAGANLNA